MSTLPANSTFLPVLDDLLSPDFRTSSIPGQTPQTPAETPLSATAPKSLNFGENHVGPLTGKMGFGGAAKEIEIRVPNQHNGNAGVKDFDSHNKSRNSHHNPNHAASKIQKWWKSRKGKQRLSNGSVDIKAERAKHSIRHQRTEDHVRFLETEVHRLKSALTTERKLRSLQLEAIRSLWSQVQKVSSTISPSADNSLMSQSMPNGLPIGIGNREKETSNTNAMTMSLHSGLGNHQQKQDQSDGVPVCSCTKEIQNLRESLTGEMVQLRKMIDQLRVDGNNGKKSSQVLEEAEMSGGNTEESRISQQKRPLTLNLIGISSKMTTSQHEVIESKENEPTEKKEISGYADQMASSIIEDAKENDDIKE